MSAAPARASFQRVALACLAPALLLGACNAQPPAAGNDEMKRALDQLVQVSRETAASTKDAAGSANSASDQLKTLTTRIESLEKAMTAAAAGQKRSAVYLPLEAETVCDNDPSCANTARAVCARINYPNAITSRYTPGTRAVLNAVVCFD